MVLKRKNVVNKEHVMKVRSLPEVPETIFINEDIYDGIIYEEGYLDIITSDPQYIPIECPSACKEEKPIRYSMNDTSIKADSNKYSS